MTMLCNPCRRRVDECMRIMKGIVSSKADSHVAAGRPAGGLLVGSRCSMLTVWSSNSRPCTVKQSVLMDRFPVGITGHLRARARRRPREEGNASASLK